MLYQSNISLKDLNTFKIEARAESFFEVNDVDELRKLVNRKEFQKQKFLILGGGSNLLFTKDFKGLVIKMSNKGIEVIEEDASLIFVKASAGEQWDSFVEYCVNKNWGGLENLSLIPGMVGASPIQNIGAYGVEIKDVFHSLTAIDITNGEEKKFYLDDCRFGYRDSIFKSEYKNKFIITSVVFKLHKSDYSVNVKYGNIAEELEKKNITNPSIKDIRNTICSIRASKLPDVNEIGSAGSFFKNPYVSEKEFIKLRLKYPDIVAHKTGDNYKLAAGWMVEKAGWKGYRKGSVGVFPKQALVIVNYGGASGFDIIGLSDEIKQSVFKMFNVTLEPEVNIIN